GRVCDEGGDLLVVVDVLHVQRFRLDGLKGRPVLFAGDTAVRLGAPEPLGERDLGARWNLAPLGCLPIWTVRTPPLAVGYVGALDGGKEHAVRVKAGPRCRI